MKKLLCLLLLLALPVALSAQISFDPETAFGNIAPRVETMGNYLLLSLLPDAVITGVADSGQFIGTNFNNSIGEGVSVDVGGAVSVDGTGLGVGAGYSTQLETFSGTTYFVFSYGATNLFGAPETGTLCVGFEKLGLSTADATAALQNSNVTKVALALLNSDRPEFQAIVFNFMALANGTGSTGSAVGNAIAGSGNSGFLGTTVGVGGIELGVLSMGAAGFVVVGPCTVTDGGGDQGGAGGTNGD